MRGGVKVPNTTGPRGLKCGLCLFIRDSSKQIADRSAAKANPSHTRTPFRHRCPSRHLPVALTKECRRFSTS